MKITFADFKNVHPDYYPKPAAEFIPEWYKKMESYLGGEKKPNGTGQQLSTAKRCMPIFDAVTAGYIIVSPADVYVRRVDDRQLFEWASASFQVEFHPIEQAPEHPLRKDFEYAKWINPFSIKTPPGYSTLFVQPFHRESVFTILPGIVDTDEYYVPVNFPFVINDVNFEGLIPAGTPIAQVIPIKRENWELENKEVEQI
jgi:hypothetical protein